MRLADLLADGDALQVGARKEEGRALHGAGAELGPRSASTVWERHGVTGRPTFP
jgi:hypothetical protein